MAKENVQAYIIPTEDPHMSEYSTSDAERRHFISRFTGSAATAVVTTDAAMLWTDGRYFLQASQQLGPAWTLMRSGTPGCPEIPEWLAENVQDGDAVGIDPFLHTVDNARKLKEQLEAAGKGLRPIYGNLVDRVWGSDRPAAPSAPLRVHALEHAGQSVSDKLTAVRAKMKGAKANVLLLTALDEIAWLFNLRGSDVSYNPVFLSYATVTEDAAKLFVDAGKVTPEVKSHLSEAGVELGAYEGMLDEVRSLAAARQIFWADPTKVHHVMTRWCDVAAGKADDYAKKMFVEKPSPVAGVKAVKNPAELAGMREAHLRDAVALAETLYHLEQEIAAGRTLTEVDVDDFLTGRRAAQGGFIEPSFPTIAGSGPNGAIIHYRAQPDTCNTVSGSQLLLVDSGGQYDCGTTDVTRTFHLGEPTKHQKVCFTRVLQGHIALDSAVFPTGTPGLALDTLARAPLWSMGLNYRHGTGHGVGAALNVHEGPQSISTRYTITYPLEAGMVVSNEPGYYEEGEFGIRIENLLVVKEADTPFRFGEQPYLSFERLTMCPLQRKMIDLDVMSSSEIEWVNQYHEEVWDKASPRLSGDVLEWLRANTASLQAPIPQVAAQA
ncbi:Creatinase/aminopeptidase [Coccomyxa subellipsoidea C-169]|uniref:Creatinase/aminopeptidase n=1 Tax=Coccomyxa subellipsoidea (strain C-169) TaxID=574566 RepID=I0YXR5_COCSC|nr:Creatinase/aminopeptidase [Coccomyxa subellipsoidea C-169]EIE23184.1 Creatinase/aminopeptidase [Coccomyxa subellipsoidea C-169]|eukprot:XP_005647728.1 Creatinase/aminopeptidase [Coccomyxa subellipsoidea C-169]